MIETRVKVVNKYQKYYDFLPFGILLHNGSGEIIYYNPAYSKIIELDQSGASPYHDGIKEIIKRKGGKQSGTARIIDDEGIKPTLIIDLFINRNFFDEKSKRLTLMSLVPVQNPSKGQILQKNDTYIFDDFRLFLAARLVKCKGAIIPLSQTEFKLLAYLCANEDRVITKQELVKSVWENRALETRTVDITMNRLRLRLKSYGVKRNYIKTLHGQGYVFEVFRAEK